MQSEIQFCFIPHSKSFPFYWSTNRTDRFPEISQFGSPNCSRWFTNWLEPNDNVFHVGFAEHHDTNGLKKASRSLSAIWSWWKMIVHQWIGHWAESSNYILEKMNCRERQILKQKVAFVIEPYKNCVRCRCNSVSRKKVTMTPLCFEKIPIFQTTKKRTRWCESSISLRFTVIRIDQFLKGISKLFQYLCICIFWYRCLVLALENWPTFRSSIDTFLQMIFGLSISLQQILNELVHLKIASSKSYYFFCLCVIMAESKIVILLREFESLRKAVQSLVVLASQDAIFCFLILTTMWLNNVLWNINSL